MIRRTGLVLTLLALLFASGCASHADRGAAIGGLGGAGIGALIGEGSGHAGEGALIGGALGALGGSMVGEQKDVRDAQARAQYARQNSGAVTSADVVTMVQNGVSEEVIANHIRANGVAQRLTPGDLITLRNQAVSDYLINTMQTSPAGGVAPAAAVTPVYGPPGAVFVEEAYGPPVYYAPPRRYRHCAPGYCPPRAGWSVGVSGS